MNLNEARLTQRLGVLGNAKCGLSRLLGDTNSSSAEQLPLEDAIDRAEGLAGGGGIILNCRVDLGLFSTSVKLTHDCSRRFCRSPDGVEPMRPLCCPLDIVNGEIMLETALVSLLEALGVLLKLKTFLTLLMLRL